MLFIRVTGAVRCAINISVIVAVVAILIAAIIATLATRALGATRVRTAVNAFDVDLC